MNSTQLGGDAFITTTVLDFVPIFAEARHAEASVLTMGRVCREQGAKLHAFVYMPSTSTSC